jgi:16S rRNA (guanine966-N2)-methyltransferase
MRVIAGRWRGRTIRPPPGEKTRPTADRVREAWMSALQFDLPGATVVDLFAGSGALGFEALSRGAAHVTFVEKAAAPLRAVKANAEALGAGDDEFTIVRADALGWVDALGPAAYDIAFADPPYAGDLAMQLAARYAATPFARILGIEHAAGESLGDVPPARSRQYGDTVITFFTAEP